MRTLLVEDDRLLGDAVQAGLRQAGFIVDWVQDGAAAALAIDGGEYEAMVLDLGLPRVDGLEVLRRARARGHKLAVLVLTARDTVADRIRGLDGGADDYLVKPFDMDELAARLRAQIRRAHGEPAPLLRVGAVELDPAGRRATHAGRDVELAAREFDLLHEFMLNAGRVLTREQLAGKLYAWGEEIGSNAIDVHIHHLRRKLAPELIQTVRGVGYLMPRPVHG